MGSHRHRIVVFRNPGAIVVPLEWSSAVLAPFVKEPSAPSSNDRGFGLEIAVDSSSAKSASMTPSQRSSRPCRRAARGTATVTPVKHLDVIHEM